MNGIMKVMNKKYGILFHIIPPHAHAFLIHECFVTLFYFFLIPKRIIGMKFDFYSYFECKQSLTLKI